MAVAEPTDPPRERVAAPALRLAYVGAAPTNPYLRLLYGALERRGVVVERCRRPSLRWLRRARADVLHLHWQEPLYRLERGPRALRRPLSWLKLVRLALRLAAARRLGLRLVWTVHQVVPHERSGRRLDLVASRLLARRADLLVAHDTATAEAVRRRLRPRAPVAVVPHGSYRGVYAEREGGAATRRRLGIDDRAVVFLAFGQLRAYKGIAALLDAFAALRNPDVRLVLAGRPRDGGVGGLVRDAARDDPRIVPLLDVVPDEDVADLFAAADVAVVARPDGGTSGSLVLALTLATPVVAAARGAYPELVGDAGWLYDPDEPDGLARGLAAAAAAAPEERGDRARHAAGRAGALDWEPIGDRWLALLSGLTRTPPRATA